MELHCTIRECKTHFCSFSSILYLKPVHSGQKSKNPHSQEEIWPPPSSTHTSLGTEDSQNMLPPQSVNITQHPLRANNPKNSSMVSVAFMAYVIRKDKNKTVLQFNQYTTEYLNPHYSCNGCMQLYICTFICCDFYASNMVLLSNSSNSPTGTFLGWMSRFS